MRRFLPILAARLVTENVPKPTKATVTPFFKVLLTAPMVASSARPAAALEMSAFWAICSISSVLFTNIPLCLHARSNITMQRCGGVCLAVHQPVRFVQAGLSNRDLPCVVAWLVSIVIRFYVVD